MRNNRIYRRKYYRTNGSTERTKYQEYYKAHREYVIRKNREYRLAHPDRWNRYRRNYEIRKNGVRAFFLMLDKELIRNYHQGNIEKQRALTERKEKILEILGQVYGTTELHMIRRALFWIGHYKLEPDQLKTIFRTHCPICSVALTKANRALDHDHKTGKIRALICQPCNKALGFLGDNHQTVLNAAKYLKRYERLNQK